jgi:hypothetical protein
MIMWSLPPYTTVSSRDHGQRSCSDSYEIVIFVGRSGAWWAPALARPSGRRVPAASAERAGGASHRVGPVAGRASHRVGPVAGRASHRVGPAAGSQGRPPESPRAGRGEAATLGLEITLCSHFKRNTGGLTCPGERTCHEAPAASHEAGRRAAWVHHPDEHSATRRRPFALPGVALLCAGWGNLANVVLESPGRQVENVSDRGRRTRHQRHPGLPFFRSARACTGPPRAACRSGRRGLRLLRGRQRALDDRFGDLTHCEPAVH